MQIHHVQQNLHQRAISLSRQYREVELQLIEVLQLIDQAKLHRALGFASLFQYAVEALGLSEAVAYMFISVSRKARQIEALDVALKDKTLNLSKASRLVSVLTSENADALIGFAQTHSCREIDRESARLNPRAARPDKVKILNEYLMELNITISKSTFEKLKRAQAVFSKNKNLNFDRILEIVLSESLQRHDPKEKAERALQRKVARQLKSAKAEGSRPTGSVESRVPQQLPMAEPSATQEPRPAKPSSSQQPQTAKTLSLQPLSTKLCTYRVLRRVPLTAEQKHEVIRRDVGRCTHVDGAGQRCSNERWLHIHHIQPVSLGGTNELANLTTLCSSHHDLAHQLSLPIEGQVTWLRSPTTPYAY